MQTLRLKTGQLCYGARSFPQEYLCTFIFHDNNLAQVTFFFPKSMKMLENVEKNIFDNGYHFKEK